MRRSFLVFALLAIAPFAPVHAAASYDGCTYEITSLPAVLTTQGTWCLKADRATAISSGAAITIATNNVTLDCNSFKLGGLAAGPAAATYGILALNRINTTVRNCNIRGFRYGFYGFEAHNPTIEDNIFEFNTRSGIWLESGSGSTIRRNRIRDTGGASVAVGPAYGMYLENDMDVDDNLVAGLSPDTASPNLSVYGIMTYGASGTLAGNRIRNLQSVGSGTVTGIYNGGSGRLTLERNVIVTGAGSGSVGIYCSNDDAVAADNRLLGAITSLLSCTDVNNYIDPN